MGNMNKSMIQGNQNVTKLIRELKASTKQYPTLNKEQEQAMIKKYKHDRDYLNKLLFMHNVRLVFNIAKGYASKAKSFDDLVMNGMKGLGEAAKRFDIKKGIKFTTYAHWWIRKFILQLFDKNKNYVEAHATSINSPVLENVGKSADGHEVTFENFLNDYIEPSQNRVKTIENQISSNEEKDICKKLMDNIENDSSLSATDKAVFTDYFYNKEKTRVIADKYGIDVQQVFQIKNSILEKCKSYLIDEYKIRSYDDINA